MATPDTVSQRARRLIRKLMPQVPAVIDGAVEIPDAFKYTHDKTPFLLRQFSWVMTTGALGTMWLFGNLHRLREMFAAPRIFMDGTFKLSPTGFHQIYTLHYFIHGSPTQIPGLFGLFTHKSEEFYANFFTWLRDFAEDHQMPINWTGATCDFELAVMNSLLNTFYAIDLHGCLFHFNKAIWAKFGELGLVRHYRDPMDMTDIKFWLKCIFGLPYLRADRIKDTYLALMTKRPWANYNPNDPEEVANNAAMMQFAVYLWNTYIKEGARFSSQVWCAFSLDEYRTNNNLEGWNHGIQSNFRTKNTPPLWDVVGFFQSEDSLCTFKIAQILNGHVLTNRAPKYRKLEDRLRDKKVEYINNLENALNEDDMCKADLHYVHCVACNQSDPEDF